MRKAKTKKRVVKKPKVPRTRGNNTMTESQFFGFIRSGLRQKWTRWPPRFAAIKQAEVVVAGKRWWKCEMCNGLFKQKDVEVDHIEPAGTLTAFEHIGDYCKRLFVEVDKLRVLCKKKCHAAVTAASRPPRDPLAVFKSLSAAQQRERLWAVHITPGKNTAERADQYQTYLENKDERT